MTLLKKMKYQFSYSVPIENRLCLVMCICGVGTSIFSVINTFAIDLTFIPKILSLIALFGMLLISGISFNTKHPYLLSVVACDYHAFIIFPLMFITEGGLSGGMSYYFLIVPICIAFVCRGKLRIVTLLLALAMDVLLFIYAHQFPERILPLPQGMQFADSFLGFIISALFIFAFSFLFSLQHIHDRESILHLVDMYEKQANEDDLTSLYNRRYFNSILEIGLSTVKKTNQLFLAMFDIDNFKRINDTCGHSYGDEVLKQFSALLIAEAKDGTIACRYGGEEFFLLFTKKTKEEATAAVEAILEKTRTHISYGSDNHPVTVSCGLEEYRQGISIEEFIERVDEKMYKAKKTGKNRVVSFTDGCR